MLFLFLGFFALSINADCQGSIFSLILNLNLKKVNKIFRNQSFKKVQIQAQIRVQTKRKDWF